MCIFYLPNSLYLPNTVAMSVCQASEKAWPTTEYNDTGDHHDKRQLVCIKRYRF